MCSNGALWWRRSVQAGVYPNVLVASRAITAAAGPRGLFTGYLPTLLEDIPDMAFKFAAYESLRAARLRLMRGRKATVQVRRHTAPHLRPSVLRRAGDGGHASAALLRSRPVRLL